MLSLSLSADQQISKNGYSGRNGLNSLAGATPSRIQPQQPTQQQQNYNIGPNNQPVAIAQGDMVPSDHDQPQYEQPRYAPVANNPPPTATYQQQPQASSQPQIVNNNQFVSDSNINDNNDDMAGSDSNNDYHSSTNNKRSDGQQLRPQPPSPTQIDSRADTHQVSPQRTLPQSPSIDSSLSSSDINSSDMTSSEGLPSDSTSSDPVPDSGEMSSAASNDQFDAQPAASINRNSVVVNSTVTNKPTSDSSATSSIKVVEVQVPSENPSIKSSISVNQQVSSGSISRAGSDNAGDAQKSGVDEVSVNSDSNLKLVSSSQRDSEAEKQSQLTNSNQPDQGYVEASKLDDIAPGSLLPGMQPKDIEMKQSNNQNGVANMKANDQRRIQSSRDDPNAVINADIEAMLAGSKIQFGARSQPAYQNNQPTNQKQTSSIDNSQTQSQPESNSADSYLPAVSANSDNTNDKINIDRSDDPAIDQPPSSQSVSSSSENVPSDASATSSITNANEDKTNPEEMGSALSTDESSSSDVKVKPVVGTEELASGPIQIEDRIGMSEMMNENITPKQEQQSQNNQQPMASALSGSSQQSSQEESQYNHRSDRLEPKPDDSVQSPARSIERVDIPITPAQQQIAQHANVMRSSSSHQEQQDQAKQSEQQLINHHNRVMNDQPYQSNQQQSFNSSPSNIDNKMASSSHQQPYPNVQGQAKLMPDPSASANRNMVAQTSNMNINLAKLPSTISPSAVNQKSMQQVQANPVHQHPNMMLVGPKPDQVVASNSQPTAQITNVPINIGFPNQIPALQQFAQKLAAQQQQQQQQQLRQQQVTPPKPQKSRFSRISPHAAFQAVAALLSHKTQHQPAQLPIKFNPNVAQDERALNEMKEKFRQQMFLQQQQPPQMMASNQQSQYYPMNPLPIAQHLVASQQQINNQQNNNNNRLNLKPGLMRSRRAVSTSNEVGIKKTFMVVTGMDLAFNPNLTDATPILEGKREDIIYGVCMPVVSLAFTVTCMFWLLLFTVGFSIYMVIRSRRLDEQQLAERKLKQPNLHETRHDNKKEKFNLT